MAAKKKAGTSCPPPPSVCGELAVMTKGAHLKSPSFALRFFSLHLLWLHIFILETSTGVMEI